MLFNSLDFLFFFGAAVVLYFAVPHRFRWMLLLGASYYFYACWKLEYVALIAVSTLVDYGAALAMGRTASAVKRRAYLGVSLACNLGLLFAFKYLSFFSENARVAFSAFDLFYDVPSFDLLLPVGISFYTFQTLSYTIDVYRGEREPERHLGIFALYVSFFPQLVAGPIERSTRLLPQFFERHAFDWERAKSGLLLMLWGFFKKLVIADRVAGFVTRIHAQPEAYPGIYLLLAAYLFAYQLYCDFSGYTDIARGAARVLGFELTENFRRPFAATSSSDFWKRWHISLTRWIRDYVYVPLARRAPSKGWRLGVSFLVFVLFGLWHGAAWTFVLFGILAGGLMVIEGVLRSAWRSAKRYARPHLVPSPRTAGLALSPRHVSRLQRTFQVLLIFNLVALVCVAFRADSVANLFAYYQGLFTVDLSSEMLASFLTAPLFSRYEMLIAFAAIGAMEVAQWMDARRPFYERLQSWPTPVRWLAYYALIFSILMLGEYNVEPFIYFQF